MTIGIQFHRSFKPCVLKPFLLLFVTFFLSLCLLLSCLRTLAVSIYFGRLNYYYYYYANHVGHGFYMFKHSSSIAGQLGSTLNK